MHRPEDHIMSGDPASESGPLDSSDPIARNPKDTAKTPDAIHAAEVQHRVGPLPLRTGTASLPWGTSLPMQAGASPLELLTSILRFKWTVVAVFALVVGPMVAAIWTQIVPKYQAKGEIRIRPIRPTVVYRDEDNGMIPQYDAFVNTEVSEIRGATVLQRVLEQREVQDSQWYSDPPETLMQQLRGSPAPAMERLRDNLFVRPRPRTWVVDVTFTDVSPGDAELVLNAVMDQYMKYVGERSDAMKDVIYRQLVDTSRSLESEIQLREKTFAEIYKVLRTDNPQELVDRKRVRLDDVQARLSQLRNRIAILDWEISQLSADSNGVGPTALVNRQSPYHLDGEWRRLDFEVKNAEQQIAESTHTANHPEGMRLMKNLNFARDLLRRRQGQLDDQWGDRLAAMDLLSADVNDVNGLDFTGGVAVLKHELARARQEELILQAEAARQQTEFKIVFENAQALEKETSELRIKRELLDDVQRRKDRKDIERNVPGSIELQAKAFVPSEPEQDRRAVFTVMTMFLGLGLSGGVAFLRANRDQRVYAAKDMPGSVQVVLLGHVPLVRANRSSGRLLYEEAGEDQLPLIESVRVMRTALLSRLNGRQSTTVLITSAAPRTGKSSFTTVLGRSLAQAGKKVLMVDADFHKVTLSTWFHFAGQPGFMDALRAKSVDVQHIFPTHTPGLFIMPAGTLGDDGMVFEETANGAFAACMGQLAQQYDIVLLDGPPILPVADATILAAQVDGAIMVERGRVSRRADIAEAVAQLNLVSGRLLGTVFVGSPGREGYGYHDGYGYGYHRRRTAQTDDENENAPSLLIR